MSEKKFCRSPNIFCTSMSLKERLQQFLDKKEISQGKFEQAAKLSNGLVNNIGEGITTKSLIKILDAYPDLNGTWLLTGKGEMLLKEKSGPWTGPDENLSKVVAAEIIALEASLLRLRTGLEPSFQIGTNAVPGQLRKANTSDKKKKNKKQEDI